MSSWKGFRACQRRAVPDLVRLVGAGTLVHHATVGIREKGLPTYTLVHGTEVKGSVRCELEVLSTEHVALNSSARALGWPETAYESLIHLKTGRTHQVRAAWIIHDTESLFPLTSLFSYSIQSACPPLTCCLPDPR